MREMDLMLANVSGKIYGAGFTLLVFAACIPAVFASWAGKILLGAMGAFLLFISHRLMKAIST